MNKALIIFMKNPEAGKVKTRLAATIGNDKALTIYTKLIAHTHNVTQRLKCDKIIFYSNFIEPNDVWSNGYLKAKQKGIDLGERMMNAFNYAFQNGYSKAVIIGTDCPQVNEDIINHAFDGLNNNHIIIGPATDGGYYLLGMKKLYSFLFQNMQWSTDAVLNDTIAQCNQNQLNYFLLPELSDIDVEKDLIKLNNLFDLK